MLPLHSNCALSLMLTACCGIQTESEYCSICASLISGKVIDLRGESIGGGKIRVVRINGIEVDFSGEDNTLIVVHRDRVGIAAHITSCLSQRNVNIAYMKLFRENKGDRAYSILEFDNDVPDDIKEKISEKADVERVVLIRVREGKHD